MNLRGLVSPGRRPGGPPHVNLRMLGPKAAPGSHSLRSKAFPGSAANMQQGEPKVLSKRPNLRSHSLRSRAFPGFTHLRHD